MNSPIKQVASDGGSTNKFIYIDKSESENKTQKLSKVQSPIKPTEAPEKIDEQIIDDYQLI